MALPSGYTKLDYIESSGTQYINTGFIPNQDSAVHIVCQPTVARGWQGIFGARSATNVGEFGVDIPAGTTLRSVYGTGNVTTMVSTVATKLDIYKNKNVCTINGAVLTNSTETFSSGYPIWIFDKNTAGAKWNPCSMKLYSCKIYDNGTLVRDFIPCKNASGTIGLWDNVNSVFYANAGTGTFSTGTKHKTLIDGTGYEIKSGRVLIAGTGYDIKKGRTLIGGTGYDIKFGQPISNLPVGSIVNLEYDGTPTPYIVANLGKPGSQYDDSCNGAWMVRKYLHFKRAWNAEVNNQSDVWDYAECSVSSYLNNTYYAKFAEKVKENVSLATIPFYPGSNVSTIGSSNLNAYCFLLGVAETGAEKTVYFGGTSSLYTLSYFSKTESRIAYDANNIARTWSTRDRKGGVGPDAYYCSINTSGKATWNVYYSDSVYIRPTLILNFNTLVSNEPNEDGIYELV